MPKRSTPLRIAIAGSDMTMTEIAKASKVERTKLSRIANGLIAEPDEESALAAVLGLAVEDLFPSHEAAA